MTTREDAPTNAEAARIAAELLGHPPESVKRYIPPHGGDASFGYRCRVAGREMLLKINKRPAQPIGVYYHRRLSEASVPVPELIAFSPDSGPQGQGCGLFEWVEGVPAEFDCADRPPYDEAQMGEILRTIHDIAHDDGSGHLDDSGHGAWAT